MMSLFTIADLHLPLGIDKPMDVFGCLWENYVERLTDNWQSVVSHGDVVVLPGDFSWATYLSQAEADFEFLNKLNGHKIILKGNHDYWWETYNKMNTYLKSNNYDTISILHNNSYMYDDIAICGNRGWTYSEKMKSDDSAIYNREVGRLKLSIEDALTKQPREIIVFTHYPPIMKNLYVTPMTELMNEYGIKKCFYGHLHSESHKYAVEGVYDNIFYKLVSSDYMGFMPFKIEI